MTKSLTPWMPFFSLTTYACPGRVCIMQIFSVWLHKNEMLNLSELWLWTKHCTRELCIKILSNENMANPQGLHCSNIISNSRGRKLIYSLAHELNDGKQIFLSALYRDSSQHTIQMLRNSFAWSAECDAEISLAIPVSRQPWFPFSSL